MTTDAAGTQMLVDLLSGDDTIAVVGSSGNLVGQGKGVEIDAHDVVVRINAAPVHGFEHDVGSRTDLRLVFNVEDIWAKLAVGGLSAHERVLLTCSGYYCDTLDQDLPAQWNHLPHKARASAWWLSDVYERMTRKVATWPSTGFFALTVAVALARHVGAAPPDVYGFGACAMCGVYYRCHFLEDGEEDDSEATATNNYHSFGMEHQGKPQPTIFAETHVSAVRAHGS